MSIGCQHPSKQSLQVLCLCAVLMVGVYTGCGHGPGATSVRDQKTPRLDNALQLPGPPSLQTQHLEAKAEKGNIEAQYQVAMAYMDEANRDIPKAVAWYMVAAQSGHPGAQFQLALLYLTGTGVDQDYTQAHQWLVASARKDYPPAYVQLGHLYMAGEGVDLSPQTGFLLYKKAAELGDVEGQYQTGKWFGQGLQKHHKALIPKNLTEAEKWLQLATSGNHPKAKMALARVKQQQRQAASTKAPPRSEESQG